MVVDKDQLYLQFVISRLLSFTIDILEKYMYVLLPFRYFILKMMSN